MHLSHTHESPCLGSIQRLHIIKLFWQQGKVNQLQACSRDLTSSGRLHKSSTQWLLLGSGNTPCRRNNGEHGGGGVSERVLECFSFVVKAEVWQTWLFAWASCLCRGYSIINGHMKELMKEKRLKIKDTFFLLNVNLFKTSTTELYQYLFNFHYQHMNLDIRIQRLYTQQDRASVLNCEEPVFLMTKQTQFKDF